MTSPLISLVLPIKNALPHLKTAVEALQHQTYRNFELIVQDGGSTDGSLSYISSIKNLPNLEVVSAPDSGIGQAYNRGIARSRGDLVCLIASDEYLDDDALEKGERWFARYPDAAVVYGGMRLADADGRIVQVFMPPAFELIGFIKNELFTCTAGFLNRKKLGQDLYYDEALKTCPDYDFWIRLGSRFSQAEIVRVPEPIMVARGDRASMSYRVESFDQFCRDKLFVLNRYLNSQGNRPLVEVLRRTASAGILTWAAECVLRLEGASPPFLKWCEEAAKFDPSSERLHRLARTTKAFDIDAISGRFVVHHDVQPERPPCRSSPVNDVIVLDRIHSLSHWNGARVERGRSIQVRTGPEPWTYAAQIPLNFRRLPERDRWYWAKLQVRVRSGQIGIGLLVDNDVFNEQMICAADGRADVLVRVNDFSSDAIIIRNGSLGGLSVVEIYDASVESCAKTSAVGTVAR